MHQNFVYHLPDIRSIIEFRHYYDNQYLRVNGLFVSKKQQN